MSNRERRGARPVVWLMTAVGLSTLAGCAPSYPEVAVPGYLRSKSPKEIAGDLFAKAIKGAANTREAHLIAGEAYLRAGYRVEADRHLAEVLVLGRSDGAVLAEVAALYVEAGLTDKAVRFWEAARATGADQPGVNLPVAAAWAVAGDSVRSEEYWEKVKASPAPATEVQTARLVRMGAACLLGGNRERAERFLGLALTVGRPDDDLLLIAVGTAYLYGGVRDRADTLIAKGFSIHASYNTAKANRNVGAAYASIRDFATAEPYFKRAVEAGTEDPDTYLVAGAAYAAGGDDKKAEEYLGRALSLSTTDWRRLALAGAAWLDLARTPDAMHPVTAPRLGGIVGVPASAPASPPAP